MRKDVQIIIISGGSASGKTTVAKRIAEDILKDKSVTYLSMDSYYKNYSNLTLEERRKLNFDHPSVMDIDLLEQHLLELKERKSIQAPVYDFNTSLRTNRFIMVDSADVIILDGILSLHIERIRNLGDIKIFIKTADDIRFIRRLQRDIENRGRSTEEVINQYLTTVKPSHDSFVEPSIDFADIIVPYYHGNEIAIDLIATKIKDITN